MGKSEVSEEAISKLIESRAQFLGFLKRRISSPDVAEDFLQTAFLKSLEKGGDIRNEESIVAWFYRVLRNSVVDYYRQSGRSEHELSGILSDLERYATATPHFQNEICECVNPLLET
jgi:RNA polymerase sigma factor (sigma-70 family)